MSQEAFVRFLALFNLDIFEHACSKLPRECTSPWFVPEAGEEQLHLSPEAWDLLPVLPLSSCVTSVPPRSSVSSSDM